MKLVMVGGHTRNIGKTSVVEGIIRALPELNWTAVKITQFGHGICSVNGQSCGCAVTEHQFAITEEHRKDSGTDTARFLAAGARRSLWVRTKQGELFTALPSLRKEIEGDPFVIVESNSLRRFLNPTVYLQVIDPSNPDFKLSAQQFFDLADAYLVVTHPGNRDDVQCSTLDVRHSIFNVERRTSNVERIFPVSAQNQFISQPVIEFVKSRLLP